MGVKHIFWRRYDDKNLEMVLFPRGYGVAYRDFYMRWTYFALIPFNLIIRYAMRVYWLVWRWVKWEEWQEEIRVAYSRGYNDGNTAKEHHFDRLVRILKGEEE